MKLGLGNAFFDIANFDFGFNFGGIQVGTTEQIDAGFKDAATNKNGFGQSVEFQAGISTYVNQNAGDTRTWQEIYEAEKLKKQQEGYKTTAQQETDIKKEVIISQAANEAAQGAASQENQIIKDLDNWKTYTIVGLGVAAVGIVVFIVTKDKPKKKKRK